MLTTMRPRQDRSFRAMRAPALFGGRPPNVANRQRVYAAIVEYAAEHGGNTPTIREVCEVCRISSTSVVNYHIQALIDEELLEWRDRKLIVTGATWIPPERKVQRD